MSKHILLIGGSGAALMIGLTAGLPGTAAGAGPQACVSGHVSRCYASLAEALAHTVNGDVVSLAEGTYKGGVTITKSVRIRGAGEGATVIEGGGPVLTVKATSKFKPVVELVDLTVTGGVNTGLALSSKDTGIVGSGGGILVPYSNGKGGAGASLTLRRVAVIGNVARPSTTVSSPRGAQCPEGVCPYAGAYGGGIATAGPLTLDLFHRDARAGERWLALHPREFALLWRLAEQPGEPVSLATLLREVWRLEFEPGTNSVEVHVSRLRAKLALAGMPRLIESCRQAAIA